MVCQTPLCCVIVSGSDIAKSREASWVVDFSGFTEQEAALFEAPFQYVLEFVRPVRSMNKRRSYRENWWLFSELRPGLRAADSPLKRYIATPKVSRRRFFVWLPRMVAPDNLVIAIGRDDDTAFGVLRSRFHEAWSLACVRGLGPETTRPTRQPQPLRPSPFRWPDAQHPRRRLCY